MNIIRTIIISCLAFFALASPAAAQYGGFSPTQQTVITGGLDQAQGTTPPHGEVSDATMAAVGVILLLVGLMFVVIMVYGMCFTLKVLIQQSGPKRFRKSTVIHFP